MDVESNEIIKELEIVNLLDSNISITADLLKNGDIKFWVFSEEMENDQCNIGLIIPNIDLPAGYTAWSAEYWSRADSYETVPNESILKNDTNRYIVLDNDGSESFTISRKTINKYRNKAKWNTNWIVLKLVSWGNHNWFHIDLSKK